MASSPKKPGSRGRTIVVGVDTGGTFTDLVRREPDGSLVVDKEPSTPADPSAAVLAGLERIVSPADQRRTRVIHGTTVALNALLTGRTARTAFVTGTGFADLLELGRQDRTDLYALHPVKVRELVPRELRFEIDARCVPDGSGQVIVESSPSDMDLRRLLARLEKARPEAVAVCLLHAWAQPELEERIAAALAPLGVPITTSAQLLREYREYERFSTATVNAALVPVLSAYLERLEDALGGARLELLQSSGGTLPAERAGSEPVRVLLSGPAGGVVGAARAAREAGHDRLVSLDMGGTSTDVAFHSDEGHVDSALFEEQRNVAGYPVRVPSLDIHTIGCGGGSIVHVDAGGILHVGPESAGADPGPVCYGRSGHLTVTDAHVQLGHIAQGTFLGGRLELDTNAVEDAFAQLAKQLGTDAIGAADGVLEVARAAMRRAIGVMTMQRGIDPHSVPLVAFGGAGGLHAAALAESLGMPAALVPRHPGALSALGLTTAQASTEESASVLAPLASFSPRERRARWKPLESAARDRLRAGGAAARAIRIEASFDLRYRGQTFELRVDAEGDPAEAFERRHEELFGYRLAGREIEWVATRVRAHVPAQLPTGAQPRQRPIPARARRGTRRAHWNARARRTPCIDRAELAPGHNFDGPALVEEFSGTTLVPPGWQARVTRGGHLELTPKKTRGSAKRTARHA